ncbi:hypothetical protein [Allorhodopirellula heiligendammensis]|uniref:PHP domain protein n=1 Tax=Allorhodopirellula heiligendammensis TaxID=2714739 RepID=A0A5C6BTL7_9BACT|nr:hypothetical protein [Allorhodopirellula heiligendammensis]TWU15563.1 hypothetical protein Poly21_27600 [Allorhodopirellula heiligendammensis]
MITKTCFLAVASVLLISSSQGDDAIPTDPQPRWWKGNIHTHSLWSDGNDFPEMIAEWYRTHDYNFLALSDHNVLSQGKRFVTVAKIRDRVGNEAVEKYRRRFGTDWVETQGEPGDDDFAVRLKPLNEFRALVEQRGRFILIQAEEISDRAEGATLHMNATNVADLIEPQGGSTIREAIQNNLRAAQEQASEAGQESLVHLNHPNFNWGVTAEDIAAVVQERFFECYNAHPGVRHHGDADHPGVERMWDIVNTIRTDQLGAPPIFGVATDDSHHYHGKHGGSHPGRGWIMVRSKYLTPEYLIAAINAGDFYASSGVQLADIQHEDGQLRVVVDPHHSADKDVTYTFEFIGTRHDYDSESQPRDVENPDRVTRKYSSTIGETFQRSEGTEATYTLDGSELYVRCVITSSEDHHDPSFEDQKQQAWIQPIVPASSPRIEPEPEPEH